MFILDLERMLMKYLHQTATKKGTEKNTPTKVMFMGVVSPPSPGVGFYGGKIMKRINAMVKVKEISWCQNN